MFIVCSFLPTFPPPLSLSLSRRRLKCQQGKGEKLTGALGAAPGGIPILGVTMQPTGRNGLTRLRSLPVCRPTNDDCLKNVAVDMSSEPSSLVSAVIFIQRQSSKMLGISLAFISSASFQPKSFLLFSSSYLSAAAALTQRTRYIGIRIFASVIRIWYCCVSRRRRRRGGNTRNPRRRRRRPRARAGAAGAIQYLISVSLPPPPPEEPEGLFSCPDGRRIAV